MFSLRQSYHCASQIVDVLTSAPPQERKHREVTACRLSSWDVTCAVW
jgi:hypothetical protein